MSNATINEPMTAATANSRPRRALVCAGPSVAQMLERQLAGAGYAAVIASTDDAEGVIKQFAPSVVLIALHNGMDGSRVALARRLRAEASTYALPIVFLYHQDERSQRSAALGIGVDDYFPLATPPGELCARLDALFWRAEAGRRAAPVVAEQRTEIDNFLLLLDAVRAGIQDGGEAGALALVEVLADSAAEHERAMAAAHGFLKLNLRRVDAVAFYGPTTLLIYLPRMDKKAASETFARLRGEFAGKQAACDLAVGLASFPADGDDVEVLVEKAETSLGTARATADGKRVVAYGSDSAGAPLASASARETEGRVELTEESGVRRGATTGQQSGRTETQNRTPLQSEFNDSKPPAPAALEVSISSPRPSISTTHVVRETRTADADVLPSATLSAPDSSAAEAAAREIERRARGELMPRRLLLTVSDPARMAQLNLLIRAAGYDVRAAFDGAQALNLLRIERPDLLVLDYELQGMNGLEALRRLRRQSGGRLALPVVLMLDAREREGIRREALEAGATALVELPYNPSELLDAVRRAGNVE